MPDTFRDGERALTRVLLTPSVEKMESDLRRAKHALVGYKAERERVIVGLDQIRVALEEHNPQRASLAISGVLSKGMREARETYYSRLMAMRGVVQALASELPDGHGLTCTCDKCKKAHERNPLLRTALGQARMLMPEAFSEEAPVDPAVKS